MGVRLNDTGLAYITVSYVDILSMSRQANGDIVAFGQCCDGSVVGCPAECDGNAAAPALLQWRVRSVPPAVVRVYDAAQLGIVAPAAAGGASAAGVWTQVVLRSDGLTAAVNCSGGERVSCSAPGVSGGAACAAAGCCWDSYHNWCWQHGQPPPPPRFRGGLLSVDAATGDVLHSAALPPQQPLPLCIRYR